MKKTLKTVLHGALIGASILVPGLSGGTTALILGIYIRIMEAISNIFNNFKYNFTYLVSLSLGAAAGFYLCSFPIGFIISSYSFEASFAVIGLIIGSIPIFTKSFGKNPLKNILFAVLGFILTLILDELSHTSYFAGDSFLMLILIAALSAVALILPGISLTYILIAFGYYEKIITALNTFDILFLIQFFCAVLIFVFLLAKVLDHSYKKYPVSINMMILGMILASVKQVFIELPSASKIPVCVLLFAFGLIAALFVSTFEKGADLT